MSDEAPVRLDVSASGVAIVTLNRPDKHNAFNADVIAALSDTFETLRANTDEVRIVFLRGAGKSFSAGADLEAAKVGLATDPVWERLSAAIAGAPCLTIAALNGTAAGGALGMVLACDLRVARPSADIFYPVMKLGFLPQPSDPVRLAALVGTARAKLILMSGARISASDAHAMGLIDRLSDDPLAEAQALAADALAADHAHVTAIKAMLPS